MDTHAHPERWSSSRTLVLVLTALAVMVTPPLAGAAPSRQLTLDDQFAAVAVQVPQFAGMALHANESILHVMLTDLSRGTVDRASVAIQSVFGPGIVPRGGIRVRAVRYGFLELQDWYRTVAGGILGVPGVVFTDIDEVANRLRVGVSPGSQARIARLIAGLGVPPDAVTLEEATVQPLATTNSSVSPRAGGYAITRPTGNGIAVGSLGFPALRAGVRGFVTNSHNTAVWFRNDTLAGHPPAHFYQASSYIPPQYIGTEAFDPPGKPCKAPYPWSYNCRFSDSAFVASPGSVAWAKGGIARTVGLTTWDGLAPCLPANPQCRLTIDSSFSIKAPTGLFTVTRAPTQPYLAGLSLQKVGRMTGWTRGTIEGTCMDFVFQANGTSVLTTTVLRCQYQVGNQLDTDPTNDWWRIATFGDSGGPVFRIISHVTRTVELYGVVWGGNTFSNSFGAKKFVFSPIKGIEADLGALDYVNPCPLPAAC